MLNSTKAKQNHKLTTYVRVAVRNSPNIAESIEASIQILDISDSAVEKCDSFEQLYWWLRGVGSTIKDYLVEIAWKGRESRLLPWETNSCICRKISYGKGEVNK